MLLVAAKGQFLRHRDHRRRAGRRARACHKCSAGCPAGVVDSGSPAARAPAHPPDHRHDRHAAREAIDRQSLAVHTRQSSQGRCHGHYGRCGSRFQSRESLIRTVAAARLMGAMVILTGLSAEVARSLVAIGVDLKQDKHDRRPSGRAGRKPSACWATRWHRSTSRRRGLSPSDAHHAVPCSEARRRPHCHHAGGQRSRSAQLEDDVARKVGHFRSHGVLIDVSALDVMDSFATRTLSGIAYTARLRGAETVVVGIQPAVAFAMIQLGLSLRNVTTALDREEGMEILAAIKRGRHDSGD